MLNRKIVKLYIECSKQAGNVHANQGVCLHGLYLCSTCQIKPLFGAIDLKEPSSSHPMKVTDALAQFRFHHVCQGRTTELLTLSNAPGHDSFRPLLYRLGVDLSQILEQDLDKQEASLSFRQVDLWSRWRRRRGQLLLLRSYTVNHIRYIQGRELGRADQHEEGLELSKVVRSPWHR